MGLLKKLKDKLTKSKQEGKSGMPYRYQAVTWNQGARRMGVGKARNKIIQLIEGGSPSKTYPYNEHIVEALRDKKNMPLWDETGGKSMPDQDFLAQWDPSLIAYDQSKVRRE